MFITILLYLTFGRYPSLDESFLSVRIACCRYVFKNLMRDWSQEGAPERTQSYGRICQEAQKQLAGRGGDNPPRVLVPGMSKVGCV